MQNTPPRRVQQRLSAAHLLAPGKENRAPPTASTANMQAVQTPTKTAPPAPDTARRSSLSSVEEKGEGQRWEFEVKHTFIHFGSPAKTLTVKTPPKSVPCNFAPEHAQLNPFDRLRTPLASPGVSTPWTVHRGGAANLVGGLPRCAPPPGGAHLGPPPQQPGAPSTLLRLSDFLPSPAGLNVPPPPAMPAGTSQAPTVDHTAPVAPPPTGWQTYEAPCCETSIPAPSAWPNFEAVPPLPGSALAIGGPPQGFPCQPTSPFGFEAMAAPTAPPLATPAPVALPPPTAAPVGRACLGSAPVTTIAYDGTAMQYSEAQLTCPVAFPAFPAPDVAPMPAPTTSPVLPVGGEQMVSFHMGPPPTQPTVSLSSSVPALGASLSGSSTLSISNRLTTVPEAQEASAKRVSICAGHFPEPGQASGPPPPPAQAPQPLQTMPVQPQLPPQLQQREAMAVQAVSWSSWASS